MSSENKHINRNKRKTRSKKSGMIDMSIDEIMQKYFNNFTEDDLRKLLKHHQKGQKEIRKLTARLKFESGLNKKLQLRIIELIDKVDELEGIIDDRDDITDDSDEDVDYTDTDYDRYTNTVTAENH